jgi:integrase
VHPSGDREEGIVGNRANGEGTIYAEAARNRWVGQVYIEGRRRKVVARTRPEVVDKLNKLKAAGAYGEAVTDGNLTVGELLELWRTRVLGARDPAPSTAIRSRWILGLLSAEFGTYRLRTLDADRVEGGLDRIATGVHGRRDAKGNPRPLVRSSVVRIRSVLIEVLDFAVRRRIVAYNVAMAAEVGAVGRQSAARAVLDPKQAATLYDTCDGDWLGNMFRVMLVTGVRPGEAQALCWDSVDLDAGTMHIRRGVRMQGTHPTLSDELKTTASYRVIVLPMTALNPLKAQKAQVAAAQLAAPEWQDPELVFPSRTGTLLNQPNVRRTLGLLCDRAEVPRVSPNELRHTAVSALNDAGASMEKLADLLGHRSTRMLDATYRHRVRPTVDTAVGVLDDLFERSGDAQDS